MSKPEFPSGFQPTVNAVVGYELHSIASTLDRLEGAPSDALAQVSPEISELLARIQSLAEKAKQ